MAHREVMPSVEHRSHKGLNNHAENSHQPARQRKRAMKRFTSAGHAQRFLSAFSDISPHFRPHRQLLTARDYRTEMDHRSTTWRQATGCAATVSRQLAQRGSMPQPALQPLKLTEPLRRLPGSRQMVDHRLLALVTARPCP